MKWLLALLLMAGPAFGQAYPTRPVTFVAPGAAGGPTDSFARLLAQSFGRTLGQTILVENVPGGAGQIGAGRVARAAPDGHTLLITNNNLATYPAFYSNAQVDLTKDFAHIGLVNAAPFVLVARTGLPVTDTASFFALMRARGDALSIGHGGFGGIAYLCGLVVGQRLGVAPNQIGYPGAALALNDVIAGHVDTMCLQSVDAVPHAQGGRVRPIAVTGPQRLPQLPEVPTLTEAGIAEADTVVWHAIWAPRATPAPVVAALDAALRTALVDPLIVRRFAEAGADIPPDSERGPAPLARLVASEVARWETVVRGAGIARQ